MGRLIYSMLTSLDGYTADADGRFDWSEPDEETHTLAGDLVRGVGTFLYGRRMYETMVFWETAHTLPDAPQHIYEFARLWQQADKVVYSRTLTEVSSARTRIERDFDPDAVAKLKASTDSDLTVDGPGLAAEAVRAGLVDEYQQLVCPVLVGGGTRFYPDGVRLDLDLVDERRLGNGVVHLAYRPKS